MNYIDLQATDGRSHTQRAQADAGVHAEVRSGRSKVCVGYHTRYIRQRGGGQGRRKRAPAKLRGQNWQNGNTVVSTKCGLPSLREKGTSFRSGGCIGAHTTGSTNNTPGVETFQERRPHGCGRSGTHWDKHGRGTVSHPTPKKSTGDKKRD